MQRNDVVVGCNTMRVHNSVFVARISEPPTRRKHPFLVGVVLARCTHLAVVYFRARIRLENVECIAICMRITHKHSEPAQLVLTPRAQFMREFKTHELHSTKHTYTHARAQGLGRANLLMIAMHVI